MNRLSAAFWAWVDIWEDTADRPWWRRVYWTTIVWNRFGRGRSYHAS